MSKPVVYVVQCAVDADYEAEFERWYADRHGPDLVRSGFLSAQMFRSLDEPSAYLTVYDAPEHNVFTSEVYAAARAADPVLPIAESHIGSKMTKGRFAHRVAAGVAGSGLPSIDSEHVVTLRAQVHETQLDAAFATFAGETAPALVAAGASRAWWSHLVGLHNLFPQLVPPNTLAVAEVDAAAWSAFEVPELVSETADGGGAFVVHRYERIFRLANGNTVYSNAV
ncbi:antibiotic biosynthesis monooxygenase family protein [Nocardioides zeae]|uniref:Uncharacterized protein n=1 Tax=Nocardioides zeae TaxID=1457234 RepID=A0AAJ1U5N6_9ACTN|nr:DUF4286 family protein [Nocardioides zeae]MDQ1105703.1 hypothetical protein [Nocardioides zeae]